MTIRKANKNDASSIAAVAITVWVDIYADKGVDTIYSNYVLERFTPRNIEQLIDNKHLYVAETNFGICGFSVVSFENEEKFEIETMYVLNRFQKMGVGASMLNSIFKDIGGPFWLKCAEYNPNALSFYRRNGFIDTGSVYFTLGGINYPCIVLEKIT